MDSWTGFDPEHGLFYRMTGDPPSTNISFVNMASYFQYPIVHSVRCNVYPPDSLGEFEQASIDVLLSY